MREVEKTILSVLEFAGGIGISTIVSSGAIKAVPNDLHQIEKVCVGIGSGMASIAANEIISRECNRWYRGIRKDMRNIGRAFNSGKHRHHHYDENNRYEEKRDHYQEDATKEN